MGNDCHMPCGAPGNIEIKFYFCGEDVRRKEVERIKVTKYDEMQYKNILIFNAGENASTVFQ